MTKKVIEIKNLNYSYPDGTEALSDISLDVFTEEAVGIIGPNGAGKSTLLLHLNGILRGNSRIKIFGLEVNDRSLAKIRRKVGLVFQDPDNQLFMPTVFDDVAFGPINMALPKNEVELSVKEALREVDMLKVMQRPSHHLSFGEKKSVSIATVLSMKPEILVLDEPSSNLDPRHRRNLINFLKQLKLTKIIVTHDLDLVLQICSRLALLDKGKIVATGNTRDILRNKSLLESHGLEMPNSIL
ncbi:MAG: energy-coupling factor ABC transporter ATP-binding protein [Candidatus Omnitrophica bacterium]|nr:energy-coupling factor ABC transporter ATP-binding protein [Candidatus Omnitrophota bacterium]